MISEFEKKPLNNRAQLTTCNECVVKKNCGDRYTRVKREGFVTQVELQ